MAKKTETKPKALTFVKDNGEVLELKAPKAKKGKPQEAERDRKFCLISYIDRPALEEFVSFAPWVKHWAMITHDKDVDKEGNLKPIHTHVLLYTYDAKTSSAVRKLFDRFSREYYRDKDIESQNTLGDVCYDMATQWRYLIHIDDPDKYQYDKADRVCDDTFYWTRLEATDEMTGTENTGLTIFNDMMSGASTYELIERYGKEYIYHSSHYKSAIRDVLNESLRGMNRQDSDKILAYDVGDFFAMILETSTFKKEQIQQFFVMLGYIRAQCRLDYKAKMNIYLDDEKENI